MTLRRWTKLREETIHRNPWWLYMRDRVRHPAGTLGEYHYVRTPGAVMIIPRRDDGRFVLVRQYRYLNDRDSVEFPAGGIKLDQDVREAAEAELREEAGLSADGWRELGSFNPFNGVTEELCRCFLATGLSERDADPDDTEEFEVITCSDGEIRRMIATGEMWDGMSLAAWSLFTVLNDAEQPA